MKNNFINKGFGTVWLIILGLILIAGSAYWYYVNESRLKSDFNQDPLWTSDVDSGSSSTKLGATLDTSNWKTYRNEKYGFEFKYPSNWSNSTEDPRSEELVDFYENYNDRDYSKDRFGGPMRFFFDVVLDGSTLEQFIDDQIGNEFAQDTSKKKIEIAGVIGYTRNTTDDAIGDEPVHEVVFKKNNIAFYFTSMRSSNIILLDQILSTFKFIK